MYKENVIKYNGAKRGRLACYSSLRHQSIDLNHFSPQNIQENLISFVPKVTEPHHIYAALSLVLDPATGKIIYGALLPNKKNVNILKMSNSGTLNKFL
jgi:hypothetical protein